MGVVRLMRRQQGPNPCVGAHTTDDRAMPSAKAPNAQAPVDPTVDQSILLDRVGERLGDPFELGERPRVLYF